ncbi:MAG TPA: DUF4097 family beta strand repeat-containing protein [Acidobacteriota bacterium]
MRGVYQVCCAISLTVGALALAQGAAEDRVSVAFSDPARPGLLKAHVMNGGITVKGYQGREVIIEARLRDRESTRTEGPRSEGMKRLNLTSTGLSVEEENNVMSVGASTMARAVDLNIQVPVRTSLKLSTLNDGNVKVEQISGELEINCLNGSVTLTNISGSVVAHALNGPMVATLNKVDPKPMSFSSMNGNIDVTFPPDIRANLKMRTDMGDIYSDFDVKMGDSPKAVTEDSRNKSGRYRVHIDKTIYGTINGGGPEIQFKNFNGSIYVRKGK